MSAIRCQAPGCGGTEGFAVRAAYEWHRGIRWWCFWRGVHAYRKRIGDCVVCCRCDLPMVITDNDAFLTQTSLKKLGVTPLATAAQVRADRAAAASNAMHPVGIEP